MTRSPSLNDDASSNALSNLQTIFENTKDAIWSVDRDRRFVIFNSALKTSIFHLTGRHVTAGDSHIDIECGEEAKFWKSVYDRAFQDEPFTIERKYEIPGIPKVVEFSINPIHHKDEIIGIACIARNVTRLHKVTDALTRSEQAYRLLFENSPLPMWVLDLGSTKFLQANRAAAKLYGYSEKEFLDLTILDLQLEKNRDYFAQTLLKEIIGDLNDRHAFSKHVRRNGEEIDVELFSHYFLSEGKPARLTLVNDITDKVRSEQAVVHSNERFRLAAEAVTSIIWDWDITLDRMERFGMMKKVLGYDPVAEGVRSFDWWRKQVHEDDRELLDRQLASALHGEPYFEAEYRVRHQDGHYVWVWDRGTIVRNAAGEPVRAVGNTLDISDQKRMIAELELERERAIIAKQNAEEMNRLKTNFLANISHEIRTPLTAILGYAELLAEQIPDRHQAEFAATIEANGKRLLKTINQILNLARIEAGRLELQISEVDLVDAVEQSVDLLRTLASKKGLELIVHKPIKHLTASVDDRYLNEILTNLIGNAIKFTEQGTIQITARRCDEPHDEVVIPPFYRVQKGSVQFPCFAIEVRDSGIGISQDFLPHIFEDFKQESTGYERSFEGTGLGLSIAARLAEAMQGSIEVISAHGGGSRFIVRLPLELSRADRTATFDFASTTT